MRTRLVIAALAVPLALLSACGDDDGGDATDTEETPSASSPTSPSADATETSEPTQPTETETTDPSDGWPDCGQVWRDGATLPRGYDGCREGDQTVDADARSCSFVRPLVVYADRFYAVPSGTIHETAGPLKKDRGYRSALASCTA
jgi:hypothetical protein